MRQDRFYTIRNWFHITNQKAKIRRDMYQMRIRNFYNVPPK